MLPENTDTHLHAELVGLFEIRRHEQGDAVVEWNAELGADGNTGASGGELLERSFHRLEWLAPC